MQQIEFSIFTRVVGVNELMEKNICTFTIRRDSESPRAVLFMDVSAFSARVREQSSDLCISPMN